MSKLKESLLSSKRNDSIGNKKLSKALLPTKIKQKNTIKFGNGKPLFKITLRKTTKVKKKG